MIFWRKILEKIERNFSMRWNLFARPWLTPHIVIIGCSRSSICNIIPSCDCYWWCLLCTVGGFHLNSWWSNRSWPQRTLSTHIWWRPLSIVGMSFNYLCAIWASLLWPHTTISSMQLHKFGKWMWGMELRNQL